MAMVSLSTTCSTRKTTTEIRSTGSTMPMNGTLAPEIPRQKSHPFTLFGITDYSKFPIGCRMIYDPNQDLSPNRLDLVGRKPFFSVLMTANSADITMLGTALWSLSVQTVCDYELVFVTRDLEALHWVQDFCDEHGILKNLIYDFNTRTRSQRFKVGVEACRGQWIAVLDADDVLHPDALWTVARCLKRMPIYNYFCGSHKAFDLQRNYRGENPAAPLAQTVESLTHSFKQRHFWGFKNEPCRWPPRLLETQFDVEDYWFFAVLAMNAVPVLHIPHYLYAWRMHPTQWTRLQRRACEQMCESIQYYLRKFSRKQSPMWHWGDMALATRLNMCMVKLEEEVRLGDEN